MLYKIPLLSTFFWSPILDSIASSLVVKICLSVRSGCQYIPRCIGGPNYWISIETQGHSGTHSRRITRTETDEGALVTNQCTRDIWDTDIVQLPWKATVNQLSSSRASAYIKTKYLYRCPSPSRQVAVTIGGAFYHVIPDIIPCTYFDPRTKARQNHPNCHHVGILKKKEQKKRKEKNYRAYSPDRPEPVVPCDGRLHSDANAIKEICVCVCAEMMEAAERA